MMKYTRSQTRKAALRIRIRTNKRRRDRLRRVRQHRNKLRNQCPKSQPATFGVKVMKENEQKVELEKVTVPVVLPTTNYASSNDSSDDVAMDVAVKF